MVKVKISNFSIDDSVPSSLPELEAKGFIIKTWKDDQTFHQKTIKDDYIILMSESEYREKIASKIGRKSNPLMVNFEEYEQ
jgi:hypothetical protein